MPNFYLPPVPPMLGLHPSLPPEPTQPLEPPEPTQPPPELVPPPDMLGREGASGESPPDVPPPVEGATDLELEALYSRLMFGGSSYSPEDFSAMLPSLARGRFSQRRIGAPESPELPELPEPVLSRSPVNELIRPTGGSFNPNIDYTSSLKNRILGTLGDSVAPEARELLDALPVGFDQFLAPNVAAAARTAGKPAVLLSPSAIPGGIANSQQNIASMIRHEIAHHYVSEWSAKRVRQFLHTPTVRSLPTETKGDWSHIFTFLGGMGPSTNTALYNYQVPPIRYVEDLPEDLQPFYVGFLPSAPPEYTPLRPVEFLSKAGQK